MPATLTIATVILSFLITLFVLPGWIKVARSRGLTGKDMHKIDQHEVAELGGLVVVFGALIGILAYIAAQVFVYNNKEPMFYILAATASILIATVIGLVDDILGWKIGLRQYQKAILSSLIALPIIVVNAGESTMALPLIGVINIGLLYPLIVIPGGIVGASNAFNMLAGFNGLEAGMGMIIIGTEGFLAWQLGSKTAVIIAACAFMALLAFFVFNRHPSLVFPGDTMTYPTGTIIAIIAILGNIEKFALILFIPYFLEGVLKMRGWMQKESFGKVLPDGTIMNRYKKFYGLTHITISLLRNTIGKAKEKYVVLTLLY
ncbi:glycosyl transferase family 4, partial [Candidatus Woesearchaeota archaeon]|nr:glycosyl transferase family 4 [Candidatus Woesearchaeota archaeon]